MAAAKPKQPIGQAGLAAYLALVMSVGPVAHYSVSALGPYIVTDLNLSPGRFGWLWFVTFVVAAPLSLWAGRLTDRWGARGLSLLAFWLSGVVLLLVAGAQSFTWLIVGLGLSGIVQAVSNPTTNYLVARLANPTRVGFIVGMKQSGVQMAQLFAGLILPALAAWMSWRGAVLSSMLFVMVGLWVTYRLQFPKHSVLAQPKKVASSQPAQVPQFPSGHMWWLSAYALLIGLLVQATNVYLPLYMQQELQASFTRSGMTTAVLGGVGIAARFFWGRLADGFKNERILLFWLAVAAGGALALFLLATPAFHAPVWIGAAIFSASALSANVVIMVAIIRRASPDKVGRSTAAPSLALFSGFTLGPLAFGQIVDRFGHYRPAWLWLLAIAVVLVSLTLIWEMTQRVHQRS